MNVVYALSAYPVGALSDRMDRAALLLVGMCVLVIADIVLALSAGVVALAVGVILWGLHLGITQGLLAALVTDTAPANRRGTAFGIFNLVSGVAQLFASVVAGMFWDALGPSSTFYMGAVVAAVALAVLLPVWKWLRRPAGTPVS
jgi:MFS family permease